MTLILFFIILSLLVLVHELGHFFVAKFFGIRVDEFGFGYPPRLIKLFTWRKTLFTLNWLPFGGFVKIFGENQNDSDLQNSSDIPSEHGQSFVNQNHFVQALVLVAGVVGNFLFAWFIFSLVLALGLSAPLSMAQPEGLPLIEAISSGFQVSIKITGDTALALGALISQAVVGRADLSNLIGPVGLVGLVGDVSQIGFGYLLSFVALISINLSLINLLPIPALDGGRLLLVLVEVVIRRKIPSRLFNIISTVSFAFLIFLMLLVTLHDIGNLF